MTLRSQVFEHSRSERYDKQLFVFVFCAGLVWILIGKRFGADWAAGTPWPGSAPIIIAAGTLATMVVYTLLCSFTKLFRVREDVLGDNVYYLGFLFTLVSLAYALWKIDFEKQEGLIEDLVSSFGIALSSTIGGIFIRVLVLQFRRDPSEYEREMRLELIEASGRLKANMVGAIEQFDSVIVQMSQLMRESTEIAVIEQKKAISESNSAFLQELREVGESIREGIQKPLTSAATDIGKAASKLKKQSDVMEEQIASSIDRLNEGGRSVASALSVAASHVQDAAVGFSDDLSASALEILKTANGVKVQASESGAQLGAIGGIILGAAERIDAATATLVDRLKSVAEIDLEGTVAIRQRDVDRIVNALSEIRNEIRGENPNRGGAYEPIWVDPIVTRPGDTAPDGAPRTDGVGANSSHLAAEGAEDLQESNVNRETNSHQDAGGPSRQDLRPVDEGEAAAVPRPNAEKRELGEGGLLDRIGFGFRRR